MNSVWCKA